MSVFFIYKELKIYFCGELKKQELYNEFHEDQLFRFKIRNGTGGQKKDTGIQQSNPSSPFGIRLTHYNYFTTSNYAYNSGKVYYNAAHIFQTHSS